jgi:hypothetical protein
MGFFEFNPVMLSKYSGKLPAPLTICQANITHISPFPGFFTGPLSAGMPVSP